MSGMWQSIDTAPKDERHIFATCRLSNGRWAAITRIAWNPWLNAWADHPAPDAFCETHGTAKAKRVLYEPTHWMPIPDQPGHLSPSEASVDALKAAIRAYLRAHDDWQARRGNAQALHRAERELRELVRD